MSRQIKPWMFRDNNEHFALFFSFFLSILLIFFLGYTLDFEIVIIGVLLIIFWIRMQQNQYLGNALRVHRGQFPEIYHVFFEQAKRLGIQKANLYIKQDPYLNAHTIGLGTCSVVLHSALVEQLDSKELAFVIAHELGHFAAGHTKISSLLIPVGGNVVSNFLFGFWQRKAEYTADRCGLILTNDLDSTVCGIIKLTVGGNLFSQVSLEGYFKQVQKATSLSTSVSEVTLSHPLITNRIKKLIIFWRESFEKLN